MPLGPSLLWQLLPNDSAFPLALHLINTTIVARRGAGCTCRRLTTSTTTTASSEVQEGPGLMETYSCGGHGGCGGRWKGAPLGVFGVLRGTRAATRMLKQEG
jgi:hypothetical protein